MARFASIRLGMALALATSPSLAQCEPAWMRESEPAGTDSPVAAIISWDADGAGPLAPLVVVGGSFASAGTADSPCVAMWDGSDWYPMGAGLTSPAPSQPAVRAFAVFQGQLVAGGGLPPVSVPGPMRAGG